MLMNDSFYAELEWVPLKISSVEYQKGDIIGKCLAIISLSPLCVMSALLALVIFRRDLHTITLLIGLTINIILSKILKHIIAEPRPSLHSASQLSNDYGMPSSHTQFMWCLSTYMFYFLFYRINYIKINTMSYCLKILIGVIFFIWAVLVSFSRIYLKYHTIEQVSCGVVAGIAFGTVWFYLTQYIFTPYFPIIASWKISEILLIRDTTLIPHILWFEYTKIRQEVQNQKRKLNFKKFR